MGSCPKAHVGQKKSNCTDRMDSSVPRGICATCRTLIIGDSIVALERTYHPDHFVCGMCSEVISRGKFFEKEGRILCTKCFEDSCPVCARCSQTLQTQLVTACGKKWHQQCFSCTTCHKSFVNGGQLQYHNLHGNPYCANCHKAAMKTFCKACSQPITGVMLERMGFVWHPECFVCKVCRSDFPNNRYYQDNGLPVCQTHHQQKMANLTGNLGIMGQVPTGSNQIAQMDKGDFGMTTPVSPRNMTGGIGFMTEGNQPNPPRNMGESPRIAGGSPGAGRNINGGVSPRMGGGSMVSPRQNNPNSVGRQ